MPEFITLAEAKAQLSIDDSDTLRDARVTLALRGAIDWACNFTQRPLGELLVLPDPAVEAVPLPEPHYTPDTFLTETPGVITGIGGVPVSWGWGQVQWAAYVAANPLLTDRSAALRWDVKAAILLQMEVLFDRDVSNFALLNQRAHELLQPYRLGLGV